MRRNGDRHGIAAPFALVLALCGAPALAQTTSIPPRPELYRFVMIQAGPGRLPDLIELYRQRVPGVIVAGGDEAPIFIRHSQGDRWDLLVIFPSGSFTEYTTPPRAWPGARRRPPRLAWAAPRFSRKMYDVIAWHEDVFVQGCRSRSCAPT